MAPLFTGFKFGFDRSAVDTRPFSATGGSILNPGDGYTYHVFIGSEDFIVTSGKSKVDAFIVAGGGGGGAGRHGAGGGAGGLRTISNIPVNPGPGIYAIVVGAGSAAMPYWKAFSGGIPGSSGFRGDSSTCFGYTSTGGGIVRYGPGTPTSPTNGGSGSGAQHYPSGQGSGNTPPVSPPQGNPGGAGGYVYPGPEKSFVCGGGGGAGATGGNGTAPTFASGNGGDGVPSTTISWSIPSSYGTPGPSPGRYFAGGGGGAAGTYESDPASPFFGNFVGPGGQGGAGGGGPKGSPYVYGSHTGRSGTTNTGGGGGGGNFNLDDNYGGGAGGSGIVIVRYVTIPVSATGGNIVDTYTDTNGLQWKVHIFTSPGNFIINSLGSGSVSLTSLVVAGGGGGGRDGGAGGGGGGVIETVHPTPSISPYLEISIPINVGAGGPGGLANPGQGVNGDPSSFGSLITSAGGGGGGSMNKSDPTTRTSNDGSSGGSGGGGGAAFRQGSAGGTGNTPPVSPPQGNPGGSGTFSFDVDFSAGGGGGGSAVGGNAPASTVGGTGGLGLGVLYYPPSVGTPGPVATARYFGGGGGGMGWSTPGSGGAGGGGNACTNGTNPVPVNLGLVQNGTVNTGGGGGGSTYGLPTSVNKGGSGIVIIKYLI